MTEYIIDSHAHLDSHKFTDEDRERIISNLENDKVKLVINPCCDINSARTINELSKNNEKIFAMVGTHPHDAKDYSEDVRKEYIEIAKSNSKIVALGEIGLDYHYDFSPRDVQREVFIDQIKLAKQLDLPIVIHSREAFEDVYNILKEHASGMKVLLHSFNETWDECKKFLELGFYISLGGMATFKNAQNLIKVVENVPIERLLLETDAPYLTPHPFRGRTNEPKYTHVVADRIAAMRVEEASYIREMTNKNTLDFFGIEL